MANMPPWCRRFKVAFGYLNGKSGRHRPGAAAGWSEMRARARGRRRLVSSFAPSSSLVIRYFAWVSGLPSVTKSVTSQASTSSSGGPCKGPAADIVQDFAVLANCVDQRAALRRREPQSRASSLPSIRLSKIAGRVSGRQRYLVNKCGCSRRAAYRMRPRCRDCARPRRCDHSRGSDAIDRAYPPHFCGWRGAPRHWPANCENSARHRPDRAVGNAAFAAR